MVEDNEIANTFSRNSEVLVFHSCLNQTDEVVFNWETIQGTSIRGNRPLHQH
jgi:hypothetical protein